MNISFRFEQLRADKLPWQAEVVCLQCHRPFLVRRGTVVAVLRAGVEVLGATCDACLSPESRATVKELREQDAVDCGREPAKRGR